MMGLNLDSLHALLWIRATDGELRVHQTHLADELCITKVVVHRTLRKMIDQGRLTLISGVGPAARSYQVTPPAEWLAQVAPNQMSDDDGPSTL